MADLSQFSNDELVQMLAKSQANPAQQKPDDPIAAATAAGEAEGAKPGAFHTAAAAAGQAANQATFGLANYGGAAERYAAQVLTGNKANYSEDLAYERGLSQGQIEGHPIAGTAGGVAGGTVGAGKLLGVVKGAGVLGRGIKALSETSNMGRLGNTLKAVGLNTSAGLATAESEGQSTPDAERTGLISGVVGTAGGKVLGWSLGRLGDVSNTGIALAKNSSVRAFHELAAHIKETPETLQKAYDSFVKLTGRVPSMAELMGIKSQGSLRALANANPEIAEAASKAADHSTMPLHEQLQMAQTNTKPQTASAFLQARNDKLTSALDQVDPRTGQAVRDTKIPVQTGPTGPNTKAATVLLDPKVQSSLKSDLRNSHDGSMFNNDSLIEKIANDNVTVGDADRVRLALRNKQDMFSARDAGVNRDPEAAKEYGAAAEAVEGLGRSAHGAYGRAMDEYRASAHYANGFEHGLDGGLATDLPKDDDRLIRSMKTPHGQAGYEHGQALYKAQKALDAVSPSMIKPAPDGMSPSHVAQGAMAAVDPSMLGKIYHGVKSMTGVSKLPDSVQTLIAHQLFNRDPRVVQQGFENLRRGGARAEDLQKMQTLIGMAASVNAARYGTNQGGQQQ